MHVGSDRPTTGPSASGAGGSVTSTSQSSRSARRPSGIGSSGGAHRRRGCSCSAGSSSCSRSCSRGADHRRRRLRLDVDHDHHERRTTTTTAPTTTTHPPTTTAPAPPTHRRVPLPPITDDPQSYAEYLFAAWQNDDQHRRGQRRERRRGEPDLRPALPGAESVHVPAATRRPARSTAPGTARTARRIQMTVRTLTGGLPIQVQMVEFS